MKNLVEKIKTYDYKQFFLNHGEKVGMGLAGLVTLLCLAMTSWGGYARTPGEMESEARKVQDQLAANRWPAEEKEKFVLASADAEIQRSLAALDLAPDQAWHIGDSPEDADGARAAGLPCLLVRRR